MPSNYFCRSCLIDWISAPLVSRHVVVFRLTIVAFLKGFLCFYEEWIIAAQGLRWNMIAGGGLGD